MNIIKFITMNSSHSKLRIGYKDKYIEETNNTKFLGSEIDNHLKQKYRIKQRISMLSVAGFGVRSVVCTSNVTKYGLILGGNFPTVGIISL